MRLAPLLLAVATTARAQTTDLPTRIGAAPDGSVRLTFAARPDVCGNSHSRTYYVSDDVQWKDDCQHGPVRIVLTVRNRTVTEIRTHVGGEWRPAPADRTVTDLGTVSAPDAANYLLSLAEQLPASPGSDAILPATLADSAKPWPRLIALARNSARPEHTRTQAVFWLGQAASDVSGALDSLANDETDDEKIREQAVFALSQRPHDEGIPSLIQIAKTSPDARLRRKALFWLGQSGDPRAIDVFAEILQR
jgi:HEAT repeats